MVWLKKLSLASFIAFRQRIKPGWSLLIGLSLASLWFAVLYMNGVDKAKTYVNNHRLESQVRNYVSGTAELNEYDLIFEERETAEKRLASCKEKMREMFGSVENVPQVLRYDLRKVLLENKDCGFYEPKPEDLLYPKRYAQVAFLVGIYGTLLAFSIFWVVTYPHIGWRRLALVIGPLAGIIAGIIWTDRISNDEELMIQVTFVTVFSSVTILVARNVVEWIKRGFKESTKQ